MQPEIDGEIGMVVEKPIGELDVDMECGDESIARRVWAMDDCSSLQRVWSWAVPGDSHSPGSG